MGPFEICELVRDWHLKCSGGVFSDQEAHRCEMYQTRPSATSSTGLCGPLVGFYGNRKFFSQRQLCSCSTCMQMHQHLLTLTYFNSMFT